MEDTPLQLELPLRDEDAFHSELEERTGLRLQVVVTENSSSILTLKAHPRRNVHQLRVHRMFLDAGPNIMTALAHWMKGTGRRASHRVLDDYIRRNQDQIRKASNRRVVLRTKGTYFDLRALFDDVNAAHFENTINAQITWGRMPAPRRRRSIRFGSYTPEDEIVRIHPLLDQSFVPKFFVRYIVFHEMLHAHLGVSESPTGRRRVHTREFNGLERQYPDFDRAVAWMDDPRNLRRLLSESAPTARAAV